MAIVTHTHERERTSRQPTRSSESNGSAGGASPRTRGSIRSNSAALSANVAASRAKASQAPIPSTIAVASAGPAMNATLAVVSLSARAS